VSPFFPDLALRDYAVAEVSAIAFAIGFFVAGTPGLYGAPAAYAPGLYVVSPTIAPVMAGLVLRTLPVKKLEILKRSDAFPRVLRAHPPE